MSCCFCNLSSIFYHKMRCKSISVEQNSHKMRSGVERCFMELFVCIVMVRDKIKAECILATFLYSIFKLRSGCVTEYNALGFAYTKYQMHAHVLTQVLYSLLQKLPSVSLSHRACTCPQVSKRFLLIHEKGVFCCMKNATIAEMLPN